MVVSSIEGLTANGGNIVPYPTLNEEYAVAEGPYLVINARMLDLITNRSKSDVNRVQYLSSLWSGGTFTGTVDELAEWCSNLKGAYNAADLNRVTAAMEYLTQKMNGYGYAVDYIPVMVALGRYIWRSDDIPTSSQMNQYLSNLASLRDVVDVLSTTPDVPESMALLDYIKANNIEQILIDLESVLKTMGQSFLRAGMEWAYAGNEIYMRNGG